MSGCSAANHPSDKKRKCTLYPPESQPQLPNEHNVYNQNFGGKFCRCGRTYDAETESEAMLNCIGCEVGASARLPATQADARARTGFMRRV